MLFINLLNYHQQLQNQHSSCFSIRINKTNLTKHLPKDKTKIQHNPIQLRSKSVIRIDIHTNIVKAITDPCIHIQLIQQNRNETKQIRTREIGYL